MEGFLAMDGNEVNRWREILKEVDVIVNEKIWSQILNIEWYEEF